MSELSPNAAQNGTIKNIGSSSSVADTDDIDFSRLSERPRPLTMERQRSFDERSFMAELSGMSPRLSLRNIDSYTRMDHLESVFSPCRRSGFNTPRSAVEFEPHPMFAEAWEALRRSLVFFRGSPVGTIAALDNSEEELNYDQVKALYPLVLCLLDYQLRYSSILQSVLFFFPTP